MREYVETKTYYTKEDCDALDSMPVSEVIEILSNLEGTWMPGRPNAYYELSSGRKEEAEMDFYLLRACKAVDRAVRLLAAMPKEETA